MVEGKRVASCPDQGREVEVDDRGAVERVPLVMRAPQYAFTENVQRGYVRLVAERNEVPLGSDHF